ncbi:MAG: hypothetical protein L0Y39_07125 [Methylococcaceae bacterium]|nr:hypothetical protein [Methylococcaceae bacterium]
MSHPGRATEEAKRCMNSRGDSTIWVVPSGYGLYDEQQDIACAVTFEPGNGNCRTRDVTTRVIEWIALPGGAADVGMRAEAVFVGTQIGSRLQRRQNRIGLGQVGQTLLFARLFITGL